MFATLAALFSSSSIQDCASNEHHHHNNNNNTNKKCPQEFTGNPVQDCIEPLLNYVMTYVAEIALCSAYPNNTHNNLDGSSPDEDLWYRAPDFERFKRDMVKEAINAGCYEPVAQYRHIKQKYVDEITMHNTQQNISGSTSCSDDEDDNRNDALPPTSRRHRRSVSFDLNDMPQTFPNL